MESEYEILDDEITTKIESYCSGIVAPPRIKMVLSGMIVTPQMLPNIHDIEVKEDDIWLLGPPRCGSTLCQEMIWLLKNDFNFEKAKAIRQSHRCPFIPSLSRGSKVGSLTYSEFPQNLESPRFIHCHFHKPHLPKELWTKRPKIVFMSRNPKDAAISLYHFMRLFQKYTGPMDLVLQAFVQDKAQFNPYWRYILDFWALRHEPNVFFLTFEEIKRDLPDVIRRAADFLEVKYTAEQEAGLIDYMNISNMRKNEAVNKSAVLKELNANTEEESFIRRGEAGGWKTVMSPEMVQMFDEWIEKNLEGSDFPRDDL